MLDEHDCVRYGDRLLSYARRDRTPPVGMDIQVEPAVERSDAQARGEDSIRKIDGLYHDGVFRELIKSAAIGRHVRGLLGNSVRLFRATALMKPPAVGSQKGMHQDSPYWPIEPMSLWSCWIPFDDASLENGCLIVVPGSHTRGPVRHIQTEDDYVVPSIDVDVDAAVSVPMLRGSALFFHSLLLHGSSANRSNRPRKAVTLSFMGEEHRTVPGHPAGEYPTVNWDAWMIHDEAQLRVCDQARKRRRDLGG